MILETKRLILRPIVENDADDIFEYSNEPNVGPNAGWKPHDNIQETKEIMNMIFLNQDNVFGIEWKELNKIIGTIGLIKDPKRENPNTLMLGYALSERFWGKGIMTEASKKVIEYGFDNLNLDLISVYCYPFNERSINVIRKSGFEYEGCIKQAELIYDGNILDHNCYSLLKTKYLRHGI